MPHPGRFVGYFIIIIAASLAAIYKALAGDFAAGH